MAATVLTERTISVSELKANPRKAVATAKGKPVAVLNHNKPQFYCVPPDLFEALYEILDDIELSEVVRARMKERRIKVSLDEL